MQRSESIANLAVALAKAQGEIAGALRTSTNPHYGSRYADLAAVWDACRVPLVKNELSVIQSPSAEGNLVSMKTLLLHSSGEWIESDVLSARAFAPKKRDDTGPSNPERDSSAQAVGGAMTYLRRYQLAAVVGVAPEDDDGETAEGRGKGNGGAATTIATPQAKPGATPKPLAAVAPTPAKPTPAPKAAAPKAGDMGTISNFEVLEVKEFDSKPGVTPAWHWTVATTVVPSGAALELSTYDKKLGAWLVDAEKTGERLTATYKLEESRKNPGTFNHVIQKLENAAEAEIAGQELFGERRP